MSAIQLSLAQATEIEPSKRGGETITDQKYLTRLALGVQDLPEDLWNKLTAEEMGWFNKAADAIESKTELPAFPDMVIAGVAATARRRGAEPAEEVASVMKSTDAKKGQMVELSTKRGKNYAGEVVESDAQGLVLDVDGKDVELDHDKIETMKMQGATAGAADHVEPVEPEVTDTVEVVTARGKTILGNVTEITDTDLVLTDATGEVHELVRERLKSVVVKVKNSGQKETVAATTGRRQAATTQALAAAEPPKTSRTSPAANGGVSVTQRIREMIAADLTMTKETIGAAMKKESLEFKQATLDLTYGDMHKVVGILRAANRIK